MALAETIEYDKIEVVGQYKAVQVRKATVVKKDGTEKGIDPDETMEEKRQRKKQEKLDKFQVDWTLYNQLIEELHAYFKTGILEGALSLNKVNYFEFISELLEDKKQKELLINSLKESKFPPRYFSFSSSFPEDKLLKNEEKSASRNKEESKDELKQNFNETQQEPDFEDIEEKLDQTIKYNLTREQFVFTAFDLNDIKDLKKEDFKKEEKLLLELSYFKNSIDLNLAIFKYLIYNNDLPWWSPFETIFEFQLQFIIVYKENRNSLFKELSIFFSKDKARTKIIGYFNFMLNQPLGIQQLLSTTVKELNKIISIFRCFCVCPNHECFSSLGFSSRLLSNQHLFDLLNKLLPKVHLQVHLPNLCLYQTL